MPGGPVRRQSGWGRLSVGPHVDACSLQALALGKAYEPVLALSPAVESNVHEWDFPPETSVVRRLLRALGLLMAAAWAAVRKPFGEVDPV